MSGGNQREINKLKNANKNNIIENQERLQNEALKLNLNQNINIQNNINEQHEEEDKLTKTKHKKNMLSKMSKSTKIVNIQQNEQKIIEEMAFSMNNAKKVGKSASMLREKMPAEYLETLEQACDTFDDGHTIHTNIAYDVKEAIEKFREAKKYFDSADHDSEEGAFENMVNSVLTLNEVAYGYVMTHLKIVYKRDYGRERFQSCSTIRKITRSLLQLPQWKRLNELNSLETSVKAQKEREAQENRVITFEEYRACKKKLKKISSQYIAMRGNIMADQFDSPLQKAQNRREVLLRYKYEIDTYLLYRKQTNRDTEVPIEIQGILHDYNLDEHIIEFANWAKRNGNARKIQENESYAFLETKIRQEESVDFSMKHNEENVRQEIREKTINKDLVDRGLTLEQIQGIEDVDRWLFRNFRNGGWLGAVLPFLKNNNSDFVLRILSMSKRERLYVYYMIESKARCNPKPDDLVKSQTYIPNLANFKDKMIATKWKFMNRAFSGGYVYWHKMDQAMEIFQTKREELLAVYDPEEHKDYLEEREQFERQRIGQELDNLVNEYNEIILHREDLDKETLQKVTLEKGQQIQKVIESITGKRELSEDFELRKSVKEQGSEMSQIRTSAEYANMANVRTGISALVSKVAPAGMIGNALVVNANTTSASLSLVINTLSIVSQIADICKSKKSLNKKEIAVMATDIVNTVGTGTYKTVGALKAVSDLLKDAQVGSAGITQQMVNKTGEYVGGIALGVKLLQGANEVIKGCAVKSANKAFEKKYRNYQGDIRKDKAARYDKNINTLMNKANVKNKVTLAIQGAGTILTTCGYFMVPLSTFFMIGSTALSITGGIVNAIMQGSLARQMFDDYFGVTQIYKDHIARRKGLKFDPETKKYYDKNGQVHDESELKATEESSYLSMLRNKISRMRGFSSVNGACTMIGTKYASFVQEKLFTKPYAPDRDMYVTLCKSYGLSVKDSDDPAKRSPEHAMLARKICGRV